MEENRFLRCVREYREETQKKLPYDPDDRFACLRSDYRESYHRIENENKSPVTMHPPQPSYSEKERPIIPQYSYSEKERPIIPKKTRSLTIDDQEHFPSLPSSPASKASKTPKTPQITPLREEFEFIPLPSSASDILSLSLDRSQGQQVPVQPKQYYQVVRKFIGGSWSDRLKLSLEMQKQEEEEDVEGMEYDHDGFPILKSVSDLVN